MTPDAVIVGGGLAGGALAIALAEAGRDIMLFEREAGPHDKVCGEFLSREAALYLKAVGLDLSALGAERITKVKLAVGEGIAEVRLPFPAFSLSRRVLDEALLRRAAAAGADIRQGVRVTALEPRQQGWRTYLQGGNTIDAPAAFLATGKHDLKGWARPKGVQPDLIGFKLHWRLSEEQARELAGSVELMLFPGGYAGLEPVEGSRANLCLLVRRSRFATLGQNWDGLLASIRADCPLLDRRLTGAAAMSDRPLAIYAIPYGHIAQAGPASDEGMWRLGDQAAVIPSFAGDGMSIALHSARLAADIFLQGGCAADYQRRIRREVGWPVRLATLLSLAAIHPAGRGLIGWGSSILPSLLSSVATATRVPQSALRRAGIF